MSSRPAHWLPTGEMELPRWTVGDALRRAASAAPKRVALVDRCGDGDAARRQWTYTELLTGAESIARGLLDRFTPGQRLALWAPNSAEWLLTNLGACLAGMVVVPVNPAFRRAEAEDLLHRARPVAIVHGAMHRGVDIAALAQSFVSELDGVERVLALSEVAQFVPGAHTDLPAVAPEDIVQIQFTSGTTGAPKGVMLHHRGLTGMPAIAVQLMDLGPAPVWLNVMPLHHIGGCGLSTMGPIAALGTQVLADRFSADGALELIESERVTMMGSVPTMLQAMLEHPARARRDLSSWRVVMSGGATVSAELVRTIESTFGVRFAVAFGQTESHGNITQTRLDDSADDKAATVGRPLPQVEVKIVDPRSGAVVPRGESGEVLTRSALLMGGYLDDPQETRRAIDDDGFLHTGDLCTMDERGYLRFVGRTKEMIVRGGENISPREIEECLAAHPGVLEAAVIGVPDDRLGEVVAAFVRLAPDAVVGMDELARWAAERLAPFKVPMSWRIVEELPLTANGKVNKAGLRSAWAPRTD